MENRSFGSSGVAGVQEFQNGLKAEMGFLGKRLAKWMAC
jgi:hypothetical protein